MNKFYLYTVPTTFIKYGVRFQKDGVRILITSSDVEDLQFWIDQREDGSSAQCKPVTAEAFAALLPHVEHVDIDAQREEAENDKWAEEMAGEIRNENAWLHAAEATPEEVDPNECQNCGNGISFCRCNAAE